MLFDGNGHKSDQVQRDDKEIINLKVTVRKRNEITVFHINRFAKKASIARYAYKKVLSCFQPNRVQTHCSLHRVLHLTCSDIN